MTERKEQLGEHKKAVAAKKREWKKILGHKK